MNVDSKIFPPNFYGNDTVDYIGAVPIKKLNKLWKISRAFQAKISARLESSRIEFS